MRIGYESGRIKLRIMDFIGFGLGIGLLLSWYFTNKNWIISDIIFMFIFLAMIKIIKFGSLKLSLIFFVCTLVIDLGFGQTI
jgi:hypothetical protein